MSDFKILGQLLKEEAIIALEDGDYGKKKVLFSEPEDFNHKGYSIVIHKVPEDSIVIKTDKFPDLRHVFHGCKGECKRADFAMIADTGKRKVIIFIEMKGGKGGSEGTIIQQLKGAQCVIAYCRSIGQVFWQQKDFLDPKEYELRFVSIRNIRINKRPTPPKPPDGIHDRPERMLKILSPHHLQFNKLLGKKQ